jgi:hypothetical protein
MSSKANLRGKPRGEFDLMRYKNHGEWGVTMETATSQEKVQIQEVLHRTYTAYVS